MIIEQNLRAAFVMAIVNFRDSAKACGSVPEERPDAVHYGKCADALVKFLDAIDGWEAGSEDHPHLVYDGQFQSDKYPTTPRGKVPLSVKDASAQDLLWIYAQRHRHVDDEFSDDLEKALKGAGYNPNNHDETSRHYLMVEAMCILCEARESYIHKHAQYAINKDQWNCTYKECGAWGGIQDHKPGCIVQRIDNLLWHGVGTWKTGESAPTDGSEFIAYVQRAGTHGFLVIHYANGDGDGLMPPYKGFFYWRGGDFSEAPEILKWMPIPKVKP